MPKPDPAARRRRRRGSSLQRGRRVFLREPTAYDRDELVALNRVSYRLHHPWVSPPTTGESFDRWLAWSRRQDVKSLLVCRLDDRAITGVFTLSQIFRRGFQNAYLGYHAGMTTAGQG